MVYCMSTEGKMVIALIFTQEVVLFSINMCTIGPGGRRKNSHPENQSTTSEEISVLQGKLQILSFPWLCFGYL